LLLSSLAAVHHRGEVARSRNEERKRQTETTTLLVVDKRKMFATAQKLIILPGTGGREEGENQRSGSYAHSRSSSFRGGGDDSTAFLAFARREDYRGRGITGSSDIAAVITLLPPPALGCEPRTFPRSSDNVDS